MTSQQKLDRRRSWPQKFADAFRGVWLGGCGQSSFRVHLAAAVLVVIAGVVLRVSTVEWCLLTLCITGVLVTEMINSALERLAPAVDPEENPHVGAALDIGAAAVLLSALGASVVGAIVFLPKIVALLLARG